MRFDARFRRVTLAGWVLLTLAWFGLTLTEAAPPELAVGLTLVLAGVTAIAVAGTTAGTRIAAGALFVVGGSALLAATAQPAWIPVGERPLSLVADLAILAALLLVLSSRFDGGADEVTP